MADRPHQPGTEPEGPAVEHEPTISYIPPEMVLSSRGAGARIHGAFTYALVVEQGPRAGMAFVLAEGVTTFGRDPECDMFLDDVTVSRHHGQFIVEGDTLVVEDVGSTNGTYVNMERTDRSALHHGDEVVIGKYRLIVAHGDG